MVKRRRELAETEGHSDAKRVKSSEVDHLSRLSPELILRVLSSLAPSQLCICQRLSRKYKELGGDSSLWKPLYFDRFVRPRATRVPGLKQLGSSNADVRIQTRASKWLDEHHLVERGSETDWKQQYKTRHNWSRGNCAVEEIPVSEQHRIPPVVVHLHDGVIFIADKVDGLRAWSAKDGRRLLAHTAIASNSHPSPPTALSIESSTPGTRRVVLGFEDGSFHIYAFREGHRQFTRVYEHASSGHGVVMSVATVWPYVLIMEATQRLSLYKFEYTGKDVDLSQPSLVHSLRSHSVWPPLSTSLRQTTSSIIISIAYSLPTYLSGWTVGVQEIKISRDGGFTNSRTASAIEEHYRPLAFTMPPMMSHLASVSASSLTLPGPELYHIHSKPTSLSYTHPYLLVSHPDNTLTLYLVSSTTDSLTIGLGSRLWGHTSSVSGAHVGGRGKAVSVSRRGEELRVWELEGGFASSTARKRLASSDLSVRVKPFSTDGSQAGLDLHNIREASNDGTDPDNDDDTRHELTITRGWIGFDEENVVVLKEESRGKQALVVYDFT